ncbi:MAG: chromosome segregation protein SMC, partial [Deltaproteobacteria bacterium]|nr:chromosome segregation protein SMC [Deltaproteobacteria bacterium]
MKLKQLDIVGFKSFVDKTTVRFPDGICAVVGPNGCGKSNIVDAMRWVMGEQSVKQLRGKSMEDVIFSGSEHRGPTNMAEVALTIVNDNGTVPEEYRHYSEIMVSRRLFRSGESGYFINKQPCRLKDVQNLLAGTGLGSKAYAIVEQGKISTLIDAGPEERRYFIEEAAGITRYKSRKHEALLKVKRTQNNLLRISDVIYEVKRQMNSQKRQARKAERYKALQARIQDLEVKLAVHQYKTITAQIREAGKLLEALKDTDFQHESELAKLDAEIQRIKEDRAARYHQITEERARRHDIQRRLDKLEADIAYATRDLERFDTEAGQCEAEIKGIEEKARDIDQECRALEVRKAALTHDTQKARKALESEHAHHASLKVKVVELNRTLDAAKSRLVNLTGEKAAYENTLNAADRNKAALSKRLGRVMEEKGECEQEISDLESRLARLEDSRKALQKNHHEVEQQGQSLDKQVRANREALAAQIRRVQQIELERQKMRSHYATLKKMDENYEWFKKGVRNVMKRWKAGKLDQAGICGLLADVIEPEASYEAAVEAALGDALQYVIVKKPKGGLAAIEALRSSSGGKCGFVPLDGVRPLGLSRPGSGEHQDRLIEHIKIRQDCKQAMEALLGHVLVVDDLSQALTLRERGQACGTIVTKQGDRLCLQGLLAGGTPENGSGGILIKKREIKGISKRISTLENQLKAAQEEQKRLE